MVHIEPCPFCGVATRLREYQFCDIIECENENCYVKPSISMSHYNGDHRNAYLLVEEWNTRYEQTCTIEGYDNGCDYDIDDNYCQIDIPKYMLSCGHESYGNVKPSYCPECGTKVVYE